MSDRSVTRCRALAAVAVTALAVLLLPLDAHQPQVVAIRARAMVDVEGDHLIHNATVIA